MDRSIPQFGAQARSADVAFAQRAAMVGLGFALQDLMGTSTSVSGLACTATAPASLAVQIGVGRIYSLQNVDNSAYGPLTADTTHTIIKQGILYNAVTLNCPAPGSAGQSINYLVEGQYQDSDTNAVVQQYFNTANPNQPLNGPGGNNQAQATQRQGFCVVQVKPGVAATTGSQVTPSADSGWTALYVITVAFGQTTITSSNISTVAGAPFLGAVAPLAGTLTLPLTGFGGSAPNCIVTYSKVGNNVILNLEPALGTSNAATMTLPNLPAFLAPTRTQLLAVTDTCLEDNGANLAVTAGHAGSIQVFNGSTTLTFLKDGGSASWTPTGTKGVGASFSISYLTN